MTREFVSGNGGKVSAMALVCAGFFSFFKGGGEGVVRLGAANVVMRVYWLVSRW